MIRLRKLGRPEFDVSSERLTLRPNLEQAIDKILQEAGFERVNVGTPKTTWNRTLVLYE